MERDELSNWSQANDLTSPGDCFIMSKMEVIISTSQGNDKSEVWQYVYSIYNSVWTITNAIYVWDSVYGNKMNVFFDVMI